MSNYNANIKQRSKSSFALYLPTYLKYLQIRVLKMPYITGLAAQFKGARL